MNDFFMSVLSVIGVGAIFLIGIVVGAMLIIGGIKKIFHFLFK